MSRAKTGDEQKVSRDYSLACSLRNTSLLCIKHMWSASCQTFSHHIFPGCRFCLVEDVLLMQSPKWSFLANPGFPTIPLLALQEQRCHCCMRMRDIAVGHQWLTGLSPTPMVPGTRWQSPARAPSAADKMLRSASSLTLPSHSWWFTGPNASMKLSPWEPWSLPTGEPFLQLPERTMCQPHEDFSLWRNLINF